MPILKRIESIIINRFDQEKGAFRFFLGTKRIGSLENIIKDRNIFFLMAPTFGNVGDEAIVESTILFLNDMFPEYNVIVIDYHDTLQTLKEIRRIIKTNDFIVLQGGGNIGTLYYDAERMREFIIHLFPDTQIVSMPQSMFFANTPDGNRKLERCKRIYNAHPNLTLIARERYSFSSMKEAFPRCNVILNPDIVFYYSKEIADNPCALRAGVMTCLRTDKEDVLGTWRNEFISKLADKYEDLIIADTCVPREIPREVRKYEVNSLIQQFKRSKLVITDRLHGMVLAALTNTPCLVMPSLDKKVIGTYEWIENIEFIKFVESQTCENVIAEADKLTCSEFSPFDWTEFRNKHFTDLRNRIGV